MGQGKPLQAIHLHTPSLYTPYNTLYKYNTTLLRGTPLHHYTLHYTTTDLYQSSLLDLPPQLHQWTHHHKSPAAACPKENILTNCFSIGPTVAARHELHSTVPYCTALHNTVLHCSALHCSALHSTTLYYTVLHLPTPALHCPSAPAPLVTLPVQCRETGSGLTAAASVTAGVILVILVVILTAPAVILMAT